MGDYIKNQLDFLWKLQARVTEGQVSWHHLGIHPFEETFAQQCCICSHRNNRLYEDVELYEPSDGATPIDGEVLLGEIDNDDNEAKFARFHDLNFEYIYRDLVRLVYQDVDSWEGVDETPDILYTMFDE